MWINENEFLIKDNEIPRIPVKFSEEAKNWWREMKRRCLEGYSVGGKWMPPTLYFYINFWNIEISKAKAKQKVIGRPWLRDIEWEVFYGWIVARGLSGFSDLKLEEEDPSKIVNIITNLQNDPGIPFYERSALDFMLMSARETGKELADYEVIITKNGEIPISQTFIGQEIASPNGYSKITGKYPQGIKDIYRFTLGDGRIIDCGINHLWTVYDQSYFQPYILTTKQLLEKGITTGKKKKYRWHLPNSQEVEFSTKNQLIHPYILGALLGDGTLTTKTPKLSSIDDFIIKKFEQLLPLYQLHRDISTCNYNITYHGPDKYNPQYKYGHNPLVNNIQKINLNVKCAQKFIPDVYKFGNIQQRYELVRGLMDTDGSVNSSGSIEFINKSLTLVNDLAYVLRSLGINCQIGLDNRTGNRYYICKKKKVTIHGQYYRLYIKTDKPIFSLPRKLNRIQPRKCSNKVRIINIEKLPIQHSCTCITVDNPDGLFLTSNFVVTHNSFIASAIIGHEWLFNGEKSYIIPEERKQDHKPKSHVTVGAGDAKYSKKLLEKVRLGIDMLLRQSINFNGIVYPHPFFQNYTGSWQPGKEIVAEYKKKIGNQWSTQGSGSVVKHITYKDNPFAGQGTRNSIMVKEEIGFFNNLIAAQEADVETMMSGTDKYGSCMYIGTGGDMDCGTLDAYKMFYSPDTYSLLAFNDKWENKGKISLFIPATMRPNEFKDEYGNTKYDIAEEHFLGIREKLRSSKNGANQLNAHIQYNPLKPSEMFLRTNVNIFPVAELKDWLAELETKSIYRDAEFVGELVFNEEGVIEPRLNNRLEAIRDFPITRSELDLTGAVVIYHHPQLDTDGTIPWGRYVGGIDPYDNNKSTTASLGSCLIVDKISKAVMAEYTGRPKFAEMCWETMRRLLLYYNAICLYENQMPGIKQYFERKNSLHLLMKQPKYLKDVIPSSNVERQYGMHMNVQLKDHGEILIRDHLQTEENNVLNLRKIRCVPLIQELILYDEDGNFDRCLVKDVQVSTIDGFRAIQNIQIGDMVLTHDGSYCRVLETMQHETNNELIELHAIGDYENLIVTDNHPVLCASTNYKKHSKRICAINNIGFINAKDLNKKYQFALIPKRKNLNHNPLDEHMLYLMGWIFADGYINYKIHKISICLQFNQEHIANKLISLINSVTQNELGIYTRNRQYKIKPCQKTIHKTSTGGYIKISKTSKFLSDIMWNAGYRQHDKWLSQKMFSSKNMMPFVIGFLEGDGHQKEVKYDGYNRNIIECSITQKTLMKQIRQILIDNNIWSSIRLVTAKNNAKEQYNINISGKYVNRLLEYYKSEKFNQHTNQYRKELQIETEDGFWTPIKIVNTIREPQVVYNIEVQNNNTYVANNITTHNCMAFMMCMYALQELHKQKVIMAEDNSQKLDPFFSKKLFQRRSAIRN